MDSTLTSTHPNEETPSLNRARRAALGSFAGAVVDWYDFLLYGITAALVFNREFFPQVSPATVTVSLADRVIYQTKVPPGPFIIQDLNQSVQGTLDVKVTEEDGRVSTDRKSVV